MATPIKTPRRTPNKKNNPIITFAFRVKKIIYVYNHQQVSLVLPTNPKKIYTENGGANNTIFVVPYTDF